MMVGNKTNEMNLSLENRSYWQRKKEKKTILLKALEMSTENFWRRVRINLKNIVIYILKEIEINLKYL